MRVEKTSAKKAVVLWAVKEKAQAGRPLDVGARLFRWSALRGNAYQHPVRIKFGSGEYRRHFRCRNLD